ncbi:hypothetical protein [Variovorax rhizosphaerae]|uniref:Uncharacterized protein n=1 Tax=Variovorax rhizosphaerae TaxID=1836200 RepID=A0ABU8WUB1_9BURK
MPFEYQPAPRLQIATFGSGSEVDAAVARELAEHRRAWNAQQRALRIATETGDATRDAILAGKVTVAEIEAVLTRSPPPVLTLRARIAAAWRIVFQKGTSHARET